MDVLQMEIMFAEMQVILSLCDADGFECEKCIFIYLHWSAFRWIRRSLKNREKSLKISLFNFTGADFPSELH